jgi:AcrR family transcriptional regulator
MPRPRFLRASPEVQQAILDAAVRELGEHGYEGASLNRILLSAGFSKGAFYYYFDDKADLAAAVLEREMRRWDLRAAPPGGNAETFWPELACYASGSLDLMRESPASRDLITRLGAAMPRHPELVERLGPLIAEMEAKLTIVWQHGQEIGAVRTDLPVSTLIALARAVKTTLGAAMLSSDCSVTHEELQAFTRAYFDLLRRMMAPGQEGTA